MNCTCCGPQNINDLDNTFDATRAAKEANSYLEEGLGDRGEKLIAYLVEHLSKSVTVLDVGCGVGGVHYELLRRGIVAEAIGVEASSAYLDAARRLGEQLDMDDQVRYVHGDFSSGAVGVNPADVVVLDRVICCYPHLNDLMEASLKHTDRFLVLSYPREAWWVRIALGFENAIRRLRRQEFRTYLHPHAAIHSLAAKGGLTPVHTDIQGSWQITVFERV